MVDGTISRSTSKNWPLFRSGQLDREFQILSLSVERTGSEFRNQAAQRRCAEWLSRALHALRVEWSIRVLTVVVTERLTETRSSKLLASRAAPWDRVNSDLPIPAGDRTEHVEEQSDRFRFVGTIRTDLSQLDESLELTRDLDAAVFIDLKANLDSSVATELVLSALAEHREDGAFAGQNRSWGQLAPAVVEAGLCALRVTGRFDDRESGIDIFAPPEVLELIEQELLSIRSTDEAD